MTRELRLARDLHPVAWWLWALGMATAASRTSNPLMLLLIVAVVSLVVAARRSDEAWARGFRIYLIMGLVVISMRVVFRMVLDAQYGEHILFNLPEIPLPGAAAGIRLGGPVSLEGVLAALYDGLRLATLLICLGAANVLANPKRMLRSVPSALYEVGTSITVALTVAPQLIESTVRITRARRLRGDVGRGTRWLSQVVVPVLTEALDRSLLLAAAMDSRGYGRTAGVPRSSRRLTTGLILGGLLGVAAGTYGLLDSTTPWLIGTPVLFLGLVSAVAGFVGSGRRVTKTRYRPDKWRVAEFAVVASGLAAAVMLMVASNVEPLVVNPPVQPLSWPQMSLIGTVGVLLGALPAWAAPPRPERSTSRDDLTAHEEPERGSGPVVAAEALR